MKRQYESIKDEIREAYDQILKNTAFVGGEFVRKFEEEFARYLDIPYVIGMGNGTDSLIYALKALQIGPGDEVLVPAFTFIATWEAVSWVGAIPVPVDVHPTFFTIDENKLEKKITSRTRAIIPVHIYGNVVNMDRIIEVANQHNLLVVEDAAQAHGAECLTHYKLQPDGEWEKLSTPEWRKVGTIGHVGCFSFYPGKNLGAYGDAGAVVTAIRPLAEQLKMLHDHGSPEKYHHHMVGGNSRLDAFQAATLSIKLNYLDEWNKRRKEIASRYNHFFRNFSHVHIMEIPPYAKPVYHIYPLLVEERQKILERLKKKNIFCGIHYPIPNHLQPAYSSLQYRENSFPVSEQIFYKEISLPMFPELSDSEVDYILHILQELLG